MTADPAHRPTDWRLLLINAVAPLEQGARKLTVNNFRNLDDETPRPGRTAAVLVPILDLPRPELVLTRRADHLKQHPGQVSFPGGAAEKNDPSGVSTALREAHEEIGLEPTRVTPIGFLDRFDSVSDYRVLPVVALVKPQVSWKLDLNEVSEVFTVPLEVVLDQGRYREHSVARNGVHFTYHSLEWQGKEIWGLTAAMMLNLQYRISQLV